MASRLSHLIPSFKSLTVPHQNTVHETLHAPLIPESAPRPGLNPQSFGEHVKNRPRGVRQLPDLSLVSAGSSQVPLLALDSPNAFSPIGASKGVRVSLTINPPDVVPSTVVWALSQPAWGQWPSHIFTYCISVMTENDARAAYVFNASPLPPVYECIMDCVEHLWLIVPERPSAGGQMQLTEEQMKAAVTFYERAGVTDEEKEEKKGVSRVTDCCRLKGDGAGRCVENNKEGAVLLSCADGNEVDAVALAVLLLAHQSRGYDCQCALDGNHGGPSGTAYGASRLIEEDPGVSYVWKGLLGWQDVERLQAALW